MLEINKVSNGFKMLIVDDSSDTSDPIEMVYQFRPVSSDRKSELLAFRELVLDMAEELGIHYDGFSEYNLEVRTDMVGDEIELTEDNI